MKRLNRRIRSIGTRKNEVPHFSAKHMLSTKEIYHIIKTPLYALKSTTALLMLLVLFMTGACNHIDLVDEVSSNRVPVRMIFDWSDDQGANPKGMTLYIYRIGLTRATSPYIYYIK